MGDKASNPFGLNPGVVPEDVWADYQDTGDVLRIPRATVVRASAVMPHIASGLESVLIFPKDNANKPTRHKLWQLTTKYIIHQLYLVDDRVWVEIYNGMLCRLVGATTGAETIDFHNPHCVAKPAAFDEYNALRSFVPVVRLA